MKNVGKKNEFIKPIYCFYYEEYNGKNVHFCEKADCYIQYDHFNKMVVRADSQTSAETGRGGFSRKLFKNRWEMDCSLKNDAQILHRIRKEEQRKEDVNVFKETMNNFGLIIDNPWRGAIMAWSIIKI